MSAYLCLSELEKRVVQVFMSARAPVCFGILAKDSGLPAHRLSKVLKSLARYGLVAQATTVSHSCWSLSPILAPVLQLAPEASLQPASQSSAQSSPCRAG